MAAGMLIPSQRVVPVEVAVAAWLFEIILVVALSGHSFGARAGMVISGMCLSFPRFVIAPPWARLLLLCFLCVPVAASAALALHSPIPKFRSRLAWLCGWSERFPIRQQSRRFDGAALLSLAVATLILAATLALAQTDAVSESPLRWPIAGIALLSVAEMFATTHRVAAASAGLCHPPLFASPHGARSIAEFWSHRWYIPAAELLRRACFRPLSRHGIWIAVFSTFAVSAVGHALLAFMVLGQWKIAVACGSFFLVQGALLGVERHLQVRRWPAFAARIWTLGSLLLSSPLVLEPLLRILEKGGAARTPVIVQTLAVLGFAICLSSLLTLVTAVSVAETRPGK